MESMLRRRPAGRRGLHTAWITTEHEGNVQRYGMEGPSGRLRMQALLIRLERVWEGSMWSGQGDVLRTNYCHKRFKCMSRQITDNKTYERETFTSGYEEIPTAN